MNKIDPAFLAAVTLLLVLCLNSSAALISSQSVSIFLQDMYISVQSVLILMGLLSLGTVILIRAVSWRLKTMFYPMGTFSAFICITVIGMMVVGCSGKSHSNVMADTQVGLDQTSSLPEWVYNPPKNPNYLYKVGYAENEKMLDALYDAGKKALSDLEPEVRDMVLKLTNGYEKKCKDPKTIKTALPTIADFVVDEALKNYYRVVDHSIIHTDNPLSFKAYVLIELAVIATKVPLVEKVNSDPKLRNQCRQLRDFLVLSGEVEEYKKALEKERAKKNIK